MLTRLLKCPNNFKSTPYLKSILDQDVKINSFAFNTGHVELSLFENNYNISVHSNKYHIYEFWRCLLNSPDSLLHSIEYLHENMNDRDVLFYKNNWNKTFKDPYDRAALFYLLNRYSQHGAFTRNAVDKNNLSYLNLRTFKKASHSIKELKLVYDQNDNYSDSFSHFGSDDLIMLPVGLYEQNFLKHKKLKTSDAYDFDHNELKKILLKKEQKIILIYKYNKLIDDLYKRKVYIDQFGLKTENPKKAEDVIITNFEL